VQRIFQGLYLEHGSAREEGRLLVRLCRVRRGATIGRVQGDLLGASKSDRARSSSDVQARRERVAQRGGRGRR